MYALNVSGGMDILVRFRVNLPLLLSVLPWAAAFCFSVSEEHHVGGNENEVKPAGFLNEVDGTQTRKLLWELWSEKI